MIGTLSERIYFSIRIVKMGDWHQDLVIKNVSDEELDDVIDKVITYLQKTKIISTKKADNILNKDFGYCPGQNWDFVVRFPEEYHFLDLKTNGLEVRKGRTVFYVDGRDFKSIDCPNCGENNVECDWGELFNQWLKNPNLANLQCKKCGTLNSISEYKFEPKWVLSNLGFVFWNWPILKESFIEKLEKVTGKKIEKVEGKL